MQKERERERKFELGKKCAKKNASDTAKRPENWDDGKFVNEQV